MNARQLRTLGFHTMFRDGFIIVSCPNGMEVWTAEVRGGEWMRAESLSDPIFTKVPSGLAALPHPAELFRTLEACYCDNGVGLCDFCGNIRPAPETTGEWMAIEGMAKAKAKRTE